ncbi:MAG TPA: alpha/beta hydrolase [Terrimesophilobacter sp.]|nr:alpha/beta hydrolase [Terrimesophilobacter sp.]
MPCRLVRAVLRVGDTGLMAMFSWWRRAKGPLLHIAGDEGEGPVVVLIHGIASSSVTFEKLVPMLVDRHRVISIDLLGFGESPSPADATYTLEEHVAALTRTIDSLRLREPFVLVGHSMGSLIASRYAATNRRRLTRLVLVSPPIYVSPNAIGDRRDRAAMGIYLKAYEYLRSNKAFTIRNAAMLAKLSPIRNVLEVSERNWTAFVLSLENLIESQTTISDLAAVRVPVEVVYGTLDPFLTPAGLRIVEQLRGITVHRVEANDHIIRTRLARVVVKAIG